MKLVVAEKPSVAQEIGKVIGVTQRNSGYLSGNGYIVTWCVGHLIELSEPSDYRAEYKDWNIENLPIIPDRWLYKVSERTKTQYDIVAKLLNDKDLDYVVCATDAGREGELIFRLVYNESKCSKPIKRLWISSLEEKSIKDGFENLKSSSDYESLYQSALSRQKADWLVGINLSRLFSIIYKKSLNIGRVQTPTLNLIVQRQLDIQNFKKQVYFNLSAKHSDLVAVKRVESQSEATEIINKCNGKTGIITDVKKSYQTENPKPLFDLTSLQQESNRIFGYAAMETLNYAQSLYEKKLISYPRTDSKYITEDMTTNAKNIITKLTASSLIDEKTSSIYNIEAVNIQKLINDKKVTDHHAIIPTIEALNTKAAIDNNERSILTLIIYRLLSAAYIAYEFEKTEIFLEIEGVEFKGSGRTIINRGYKEIQDNLILFLKPKNMDTDVDEEVAPLPPLNRSALIKNISVFSEKKLTQPPKPYTDNTLLAAMENSIKSTNIGLGTPATRASIIERLIFTGFMERNKKNIIPTEKGISLISIVPHDIKSPELTANWEGELEAIYLQELSSETFNSKIETYVADIVSKYKNTKVEQVFKSDKETIGICPRCGSNVYEGQKNFYCEKGKDCGFSIWKNDKFFIDKKKEVTKVVAKELLKAGKCKITGLYSSKNDKNYDAFVCLNDTGTYVNYKLEFIN